jgi:cytochrome P450 family 110
MASAIPGPKYFNIFTFVRSLSDPTPWLLESKRRYGDTFKVKSVFGPIVITADPEAVRVLFTADPDLFEPFQADASAPFLGETSLVLVNGARHRRDRRLLSPPFNGVRMRAYGSVMAECAARAAAAWTPGQPLKMLDITQSISLDVILQAVFGLDDTEGRTAPLRQAVIEFINAISPSFIFFMALRHDFFGFGPWARFQRASGKLDALLYSLIAARRQEGEGREDILSLMMSARYEDGGAMSDKDLRDELLTLLFAGHETSAIAMAWAFYWLHKDPAELERVRAEIDALGPHPEPDALGALPYLDAVCQETLRIHPIVQDIVRMLKKPLEVGGYTVPAGTALSASVALVHQRADLYPEPERFRPARFIERKFSPFEFLSFGGGARRCIGASFALFEMKIVLATLLGSHRFRLASSAAVGPRRRGLTSGPENGIPMIYEGPRAA